MARSFKELVAAFAVAMLCKLDAARVKYNYDEGWARDDWETVCRAELMRHIDKGDPIDVAAYCAFMWHHGWSTAPDVSTGRLRPEDGSIAALQDRADGNGESVRELMRAMRIIRDNTTDPAIVVVADQALRMSWLTEGMPS